MLQKEAETCINLCLKQGLHVGVTESYSTAKQIASMLQINFYGERASSHMIDDN